MSSTLTDLVQCVQEFLHSHYDRKSPLLLGYSGGPDSKALLYALLECGVKNLHLAHVDHGWRESSRKEAEDLLKESERLKCEFHSVRLAPGTGKNREEAAREERFCYFQSLFSEQPYQALLLAHQRDDLGETAFKRVLEGAHLPFLNGMGPVSQRGEMTLWRPLLAASRKQVLQFLERKGLHPIFDPTNADPAFLRARMRVEIFPFLNRSFGKRIEENLALLSERGLELREYLDRKIQGAIAGREREEGMVAAETQGLERIEKRHLVLTLAQLESLSIPRTVLEPLLDSLESLYPERRFKIRAGWVVARRGKVLFQVSQIPKEARKKSFLALQKA